MVNLETLLSLDVFTDLDDTALVDIAAHASIKGCQKDERLLAEKMSKFMLYLLEGQLELQTTGGLHQSVSTGSERAQNPIFYSSTPGQYARCLEPCKFLQVRKSHIEKYGIKHKRDKNELDYAAFDTLASGESSLSLMNEITVLFSSKSITLPSLPEVAIYINTALAKDNIKTESMVRLIHTDPVIAARVVQVANSTIFGGGSRIDSVPKAINRIGLERLRTIVSGVVLRDLFMPATEVVSECMKQFYAHSIRIGIICYELAQQLPDFDPNHAYLAGILHDIGVVPVLVVADSHTELAYKKSNLDTVLLQLKGYIGGVILQHWGFDDDFIEAAKSASDWNRKVEKSDYCDLVQVALVHSHLFGGEKVPGPALSDLPAIIRLGLDRKNPIGNEQKITELCQRITERIEIICK